MKRSQPPLPQGSDGGSGELRRGLRLVRSLLAKRVLRPDSELSNALHRIDAPMRIPLNADADILRVHTSDRQVFKRCRRRWGFSSPVRMNLKVGSEQPYFWLGSGIHFAMEDFHGYNHWGRPARALVAYAEAFRSVPGAYVPGNWQELVELGIGMLNYYQDIWLRDRDPLNTLWIDNVPQVEVRFRIPLPQEIVGVPNAYYYGTLDRVVEDAYGRLWILDYKSFKDIKTTHLDMDEQISAYCWAGSLIFDRPVEGLIYQQHKKTVPGLPMMLQNGGISTNAKQETTFEYYSVAIKRAYGSLAQTPGKVLDYLEKLRAQEEVDANPYIRRDYVVRSAHHMMMEEWKILAEARDMLDPMLILYPTPTRDCQYSCPFFHACMSMDDGGNAWAALEGMTRSTVPHGEDDSWRKRLKLPNLPSKEELQFLGRAQERRLRVAECQEAFLRLQRNQTLEGTLAGLSGPQEMEIVLEEPDQQDKQALYQLSKLPQPVQDPHVRLLGPR
jgi:hypothetical protein